MRGARSAEDGVTLLELLLVLAILAMIAGVAVEAFRVGGRAWEKGERRAEEQQRLRVLYTTMARDVAAVQPVVATMEGKRVLAFQGKPDRLMLFTAPDGQADLPFSTMVRGVAYFVEPGKGLSIRESYPLVEGNVSFEPKEGRVRLVDPQAVRIRFRYLAPSQDKVSPPQWVEEWEPREVPKHVRVRFRPALGELPMAVEVTVMREEDGEPEVSAGKRQAATFLLPIQVGRRF